jgi:SNF2 family DNA or RNA helicase
VHRIGQTRSVIVKRFVLKGTVEERILSTRRKMVTDLSSAVGTNVDGLASECAMDALMHRPAKRARTEDEENIGNRKFERLQMLESLFGFGAQQKVIKA